MENGEPNPLFVSERASWINKGERLPDPSISELAFNEPVLGDWMGGFETAPLPARSPNYSGGGSSEVSGSP